MLSCIVVFCTTYALILPAITMTKEPVCGKEEHTHTDECYSVEDEEESLENCSFVLHSHTKDCYDKDGKLVCSRADFAVHKHIALCFDENSRLLCPLAEIEEHKHDESCFEETKKLVCTLSEGEAESETSESEVSESSSKTEAETPHVHTEDCYETEKRLVCEKKEVVLHTHTEDCYDDDENLVCGKLEVLEHEHDESCLKKEEGKKVLVCTLPEHAHDEVLCYPDDNGEEEKYICGLGEHTHDEECYSGDGSLICSIPEHTHSADCLPPAETTTLPDETETTVKEDKKEEEKELSFSRDFEYEDKELSLTLHVKSENELSKDTSLVVKELSKDEARAFESYSEENKVSESDRLLSKGIALTENGKKLDLSAFSVTADVTLKQTALKPLQKELSVLKDAAPEADIGVVVSALGKGEDEAVTELDSTLVEKNEKSAELSSVPLESAEIVLFATPTANPHYTVQYYANIPRFAESGEKALTVIDTSGKNIPKNNSSVKAKKMYLVGTNSYTNQNNGNQTKLYAVATNNVLTEMYSSSAYEYIKAPNPSYVNKLSNNASYILSEVWVLKSGKSASSTNKSDWNVYGADAHFTNRADIAASDIIYLSENSVIRFVYDCREKEYSNSATFYDYNISSGLNGSGRWKTGIAGINQSGNYSTSLNGQRRWSSYADVFAFGNANTGTGMANYKFDGGYINRHNTFNASIDSNTGGCTFNIASRLENGKIVYNDWIVAPKLFNDGSAEGKQTYENSSLGFTRVGDSYTLSSATLNDNGEKKLSNLEYFFNPSPNTSTTHSHIFTNNFWPMDNASRKTDPVFGGYGVNVPYAGFKSVDGVSGSWADELGNLPVSDDGRAHNSFFGLQYAVSFELTEDYVGPLEYVFYGDDDMWVFLDDQLVCDIGGVHSSVGEYVNLWDYLEKGSSGKHTLTLFYTERGASGSTCYMNFTLPSVSGIDIEQNSNSLKVQKQVVGKAEDEKEFSFKIRFFDNDGNEIKDDYAYTKFDADGNELENNLIIHDGSNFTLKNGDYIIIEYLPFGIRYTVTEENADGYTVSSVVNGIVQSGEKATGTILKDAVNKVLFTNTVSKVGLTLQKTDLENNPLSGAVFKLTTSSGDEVNFVSNGSGNYTVPTESSEVFKDGELYYIALNMDESYVIGSDNENAVIQKKTGSDLQKFKLYVQPDGSCSFLNVGLGKWLDDDAGGLSNSTNVHFWANSNIPTNEPYQKWFIILNSDGTLKIKPKLAAIGKSTAVLDMNTGIIAENQNVQIYEDNGTNAQKWKLVPVNSTSVSTTTELETGENGVLTLGSLFPGTYTLTEITSPYGYKLLTSPVTLTVGSDGSVSVDGENSLVSVDESGESVVLRVQNRPKDRMLTLRKKVVGSETAEKFEFNVMYKLPGENPVGFRARLANGESTSLSIPYKAEVTISEKTSNGFVVSYSSTYPITSKNGKATFEITSDVEIIAENTLSYELPSTGGESILLYTSGTAAVLLAACLLLGYRLRRRRERRLD